MGHDLDEECHARHSSGTGSAHCHVAQPVVRPTEGYPLVGKMQQKRFDSSKILLYMYCMHSIVYIKCGVSVVKYVLNYL